jgi:hypothetical protein
MIFSKMEIFVIVETAIVFGLFFVLGKSIWRQWIAGVVLGILFELLTEPYWNYHLSFYLFRDLSPIIMLGWGSSFVLVVNFSEWIYKRIFKRKRVDIFDRRLFITDFLASLVVLTAMEYVGVNILHGWDYNSAVLGWQIMIPYLNLPLEALFGLAIVAFMLPTYVRHWGQKTK